MLGRIVLQTMSFMAPEESEKLQIVNAWMGRSDLAELGHIDEFNRSAGRNLGFRKRGDAKHVLLVNRRLFKLLMGAGDWGSSGPCLMDGGSGGSLHPGNPKRVLP